MALESGTLLIGFGLLIDIVGATFLVVPDWPSLRSRTTYGKLRSALNQFDNSELYRGDEGAELIFSAITESVENPRWDELIMASSREAGKARIEFEYDDGREAQDTIEISNFRPQLEHRLRTSEENVRRTGWVLLAAGFFLQILGQFL